MAERETHIVLEPQADPQRTQDAVRTVIETPAGRKVDFTVVLGDITQVDADAIVCPANPGFEFSPGGTLSAIARGAGMEIFEEANKKAFDFVTQTGGIPYKGSGSLGTPLGYAIATGAGKLQRPKTVIHVNNMHVDENKPNGCDEEAVRVCAKNALRTADQTENIRSVAFPAIGTGLWGMELDQSMRATMEGIRGYFTQNPNSEIQKTSFVIYAAATRENAADVQELLFNKVFPALQKPQ